MRVNEFLLSLPGSSSRIVVGLSGGADSVALLALLREAGRECVAVHCHFGLRDTEADRDEAHARDVATRLGAEFLSVRFDTRRVMA
ncbi:MAG: 7-cyano-7-deazaguanine synthase, partial [Muribaculaceae bacterium]|nr:7-cyano-7-deazaguanine synthase [Muribaculaceae bacterium]